MKHSLKLIILVIAVILLSACHRETLKGSGKVVTQTRQVPQFEHIKAHGDVSYLSQQGNLSKSPLKRMIIYNLILSRRLKATH